MKEPHIKQSKKSENISKPKTDDNLLKINEDYAEKFTFQKKRQALEKAKLKYGKNFEMVESESSDYESEDSDAGMINDKVMGKFIETFIRLKDDNLAREFLNSKDPIFNDEDFISDNKEIKKKQEKIQFSVNDALLNYKNEEDIYSLDYKQKENVNEDPEKKELMKIINEEDGEENNEDDGDFVDDGFLKIKHNSNIIVVDDPIENANLNKPEEKEPDFDTLDLSTVMGKAKIKPTGLNTELLNQIWGDDANLDKNERFLRNYILSEAWLENEENKINRRLVLIDREDEEKDEVFDEFEQKYNHRFEEEGGANITTYQRNIPDSYRIKDDTRSKKRKERDLRKEEEGQRMKTELQMAKDIQKEETKKKFEMIEKIAGTDKIKEIMDELEDEFDQEKFDEKMNKIFNEEYYGVRDRNEDLQDLIEEKGFDYKSNNNIEANNQEEENNNQEDENNNPDENYDEEEENNPDENEWFYCDECKKPIKENKIKYDCEKCEDYMTCKDCFKSLSHPHKMKKSKVPLGCKPPANWEELIINNTQVENVLSCTNCSTEITNNYYFTCSEEECNTVKICKTCRGKGKSVHEHKLTKYIIEEEIKEEEIINPKEKLNNILDTIYSTAPGDVIAKEIVTKFHYTKVGKEDLGLSDEMLLYLDDKTLNKYIPLRKLAPYREKIRINDWEIKKMQRDLTKELERKKAEFEMTHQQNEENIKRTNKFLTKKKMHSGKKDDVEDYRKKKRLETYGIES